MKRILTFIILLSAFSSYSQDLVTKIPKNATLVASLNSQNITELFSLEELANTSFGKKFNEQLKKETKDKISSLQDAGIDFNRSTYYFMKIEDQVLTNCVLVPLSNAKKIADLLNEKQEDVKQKGDISYLVSPSKREAMVVCWNESMLAFFMAVDLDKQWKYYNGYSDESYKEKSQEQRDKERDEWYEKRDAHRQKIKDATTKKALKLVSSKSSKGILANTDFKKSRGKVKDEIHIWADYEGLYSSLFSSLNPSRSYGYGPEATMFAALGAMDNANTVENVSMKLNFEKSHTSMKFESIVKDEALDMTQAIYNAPFDSKYLNYINEKKSLVTLNMVMSTKGLMDYYYQILDDVLGATLKSRRDSADMLAMELAVDLLSIVIDEEATAEIFKGNMLLDISDLKEREVTYKTYEYGENYEYKEVEKTKTELVPEILFAFSTGKPELFKKAAKLGIHAKEITQDGFIYQLESPSRELPFDIYILFDGNVILLSTSKERLNQIQAGTYKSYVSSKTSSELSKSSMFLKFQIKKIAEQIPEGTLPRSMARGVDFLEENASNITFSSGKLKGNKVVGEMKWELPNNDHKNSLAFLMNMIENLSLPNKSKESKSEEMIIEEAPATEKAE